MDSWYEMQREAAPDVGFQRECTRIARKEHKCTGCGLPIKIGERYDYYVGLIDGALVQERNHWSQAICEEEWDRRSRQAT